MALSHMVNFSSMIKKTKIAENMSIYNRAFPPIKIFASIRAHFYYYCQAQIIILERGFCDFSYIKEKIAETKEYISVQLKEYKKFEEQFDKRVNLGTLRLTKIQKQTVNSYTVEEIEEICKRGECAIANAVANASYLHMFSAFTKAEQYVVEFFTMNTEYDNEVRFIMTSILERGIDFVSPEEKAYTYLKTNYSGASINFQRDVRKRNNAQYIFDYCITSFKNASRNQLERFLEKGDFSLEIFGREIELIEANIPIYTVEDFNNGVSLY